MPVNFVGRRQALRTLVALSMVPSVHAQAFPSRTVRLVLPQPPAARRTAWRACWASASRRTGSNPSWWRTSRAAGS